MKLKRRIILIIWILCLSGCQEPGPQISKLPDNAVILAFGDSLTYGTGAGSDRDYPAVLSTLIDREVINDGIPGELSLQGLKRLPEALEQYQPDILILIHGGNDLLRGRSQQSLRANLGEMIRIAQARQIDVLLLGIPVPRLFVLESAAIYGELASEFQIPADLETLPSILSDNSLKSDQVHPNDQGYQRLAEKIRKLLQHAGAI